MQHQQAMMQQSLYQHPALLAPPQIEPIMSGNLPPGFDSSTCRSVYVGNIHPQVTETLLQEVFASTGPLEGCKLIRKDKSSYGFVDYYDRHSAALAIVSLNGRHLFGQPIKVNWAYQSSQREDTSGHFNIFVGDLSAENPFYLKAHSEIITRMGLTSVHRDARVMWDAKSMRSRGFGFVSFRNQQDAQSAINELNVLGFLANCLDALQESGLEVDKFDATGLQKVLRTSNDDKQNFDSKSVVELTNGTSEDGLEKPIEEAPENNPMCTTVYVGNLAPEVTQTELHRHFHALGAGNIEDVRVQRDKGFGFVRYSTHSEAAAAIKMGSAGFLCGKPIKCSWGNKPTPPGTTSSPLPPPAAAYMPVFSATDMAAYERQMTYSKMGGPHALMLPQGQHALKPPIGMGAGASQAIYDGGFQNVATSQPLMYYH